MSKHLEIARTTGVQAGMEAFLANTARVGLPHVIAIRDTIKRKRSLAGRVDAYCHQFGLVASEPNVPAKPAPKGAKVVKASAKVAKRTTFVTKGQAWSALGADETFEPNDPDAPASNGQLYRLNQAGLLSL